MSHEALIEDLQAKSRERVRRVWAKAETGVKEFRQLKEKELEQRQVEVLRQLEDEAEKVAAPILHEAECSALNIEDIAMRHLSERLYAMAVGMLGMERQKGYESFFADLVDEVPAIKWQGVRVNPADTEMARSFFPDAEIETDDSITGGFEVSADDERYRVVNVLEKRLEKGWPMALPELLKEITGEFNAESAS